MTKKEIEKLKSIKNSPEELRKACWKHREDNGKKNWHYMSTDKVQTRQLNFFLNDNKGLNTTTMSNIADWLIVNG
jgi:hypothetical protein